MPSLQITRESYRDKLLGGWVGRCAGATLGAPLDGRKEPQTTEFYNPVPGQSAASEGLDIQLVWLHALDDHGIDVTSDELAQAWQAHVAYIWDEYGYAAANFRRGLRAPITGRFDNWFREGVRGVGRADLWAMIAPGAPQVAAAYAYRDATLDHAAEGVWAAMFWAATESAAFFLSDSFELIETGLAMIPQESRVAQAIRIARDARRTGASLLDARSRVLTAVGDSNFTDAPQNIGFTLIGWLYGADFGSALCTTVNQGYATATNAAALGALLGIINGRARLPETWIKPIGEAVVLGWGVVDLEVERTLGELADHTVRIGELVVPARCDSVELVDRIETPAASIAPEPPIDEPQAAEPTAAAVESVPEEPPAPVVAPAADEPSVVAAADEAATVAEPAVVADEGELDTVPETFPSASSDASVPADPSIPSGTEPESAEETPGPPQPIEPAAALPPIEPAVNWQENQAIQPLWSAPFTTAVYHAGDFELTVDYGSAGPVLLPNVATSFTVDVRNQGSEDFIGNIRLSVPDGWQTAVPGAQGQRQMISRGGMARFGFVLKAPETASLQARNTVTFVLAPEKASPVSGDISFLGGSCWWFVGPFRNLAGEGFERTYEIEDKPELDREYLGRDTGLIRWQKMSFAESVMDLDPIFRGIPGVAYGQTTLHVPVTTDARFAAHTNDGVRVWLNGQLVLQRHSHDPFRPTPGYGPAMADVTLKPGDNQLRIKVIACKDAAELGFQVVDRDGRFLKDLGNSR